VLFYFTTGVVTAVSKNGEGFLSTVPPSYSQTAGAEWQIPHPAELYYCNTVGWTWWDWSLIPSVFWVDTVGWVIWHVKTVPNITYNVFGRTLTLLDQSNEVISPRMLSQKRSIFLINIVKWLWYWTHVGYVVYVGIHR